MRALSMFHSPALLRTNCSARAASCSGPLTGGSTVGRRLGDETVVDRDHRDAGREVLLHAADAILAAVHPAAAVDEEQQRRGLSRLGLPEIEHLLLVRAVGDVGQRGLWSGRRCGWFFRGLFSGPSSRGE